jgi:hypothetical protein
MKARNPQSKSEEGLIDQHDKTDAIKNAQSKLDEFLSELNLRLEARRFSLAEKFGIEVEDLDGNVTI